MVEENYSLREWARQNKIWERDSWKQYLNDLIEFYKDAYILKKLKDYLIEISQKYNTLDDIRNQEGKEIYDKFKTMIYGGIGSGNINESFAKFMFEVFGIRTLNAKTFEDSIKFYEKYGDGITITIENPWEMKPWIFLIDIDKIVNITKSIIVSLSNDLKIILSQYNLNSDLDISNFSVKDIISYFPNPNDSPKKLIDLIYDFKQKGVALSIGINPFSTFLFYTRAIPMKMLIDFLDLESNLTKVEELIKFLKLKKYSIIYLTQIDTSTIHSETIYLLASYSDYYNNPISYNGEFLNLFWNHLIYMDENIIKRFDEMIDYGVKEIKIEFNPWEDYKNLFEEINNILFKFLNENPNKDILAEFKLKDGKIKEINVGYFSSKSQLNTTFSDFLLKISPAICTGLIDIKYINPNLNYATFNFHRKTKEWIEEVIKNAGKI
ncbi:MAG: hypothetical protein ACP5IB_07380 [Thermoplasmata archaeon]